MKTWQICSSVSQWFSRTRYPAAAAHNLSYIQIEKRFSFSPALRRIILPVQDWVFGFLFFASASSSIFFSFASNWFRTPSFIIAPFSVLSFHRNFNIFIHSCAYNIREKESHSVVIRISARTVRSYHLMFWEYAARLLRDYIELYSLAGAGPRELIDYSRLVFQKYAISGPIYSFLTPIIQLSSQYRP